MALGPLGLVDLDDPPLSLADEAIDLGESYLRVPTGVDAGKPMVLTPEQVELLILWYQVTPDGKAYARNRMMIVGPKGWSKSPLGALDSFFHLVGPSLPDGLDAYGRPVGRPHPAPWEQIAGTSEDNTDNLYLQFYWMLKESPALDDFGIDLGLTRTFLEGRPGRVEPVTASAISRTGNPVSNLKREETWQWLLRNGGHALAAALDANARKMRARIMDLTNMPVPGTDSIAERTRKKVQAGKDRTLVVTIGEHAPLIDDINDDAQCLARLEAAYGSHLTVHGGWIDPKELLDARPPGDLSEAQWRRLFGNEEAGEDDEVFDSLAYGQMVNADAQLVLGDIIALGFDGSDTRDATALYAARWPDWTVFKLAVWERPQDPVTGELAKEWRVKRAEVKATIRATMELYRVVRGYADTGQWQSDIDELGAEFGERFLRFPHHSSSRIGPACERWDTMFRERVLRFAPDEDNTLVRHAQAAYREPCGPVGSAWWRPKRRIVGVPIDAFSAAISAVHALGDAVAEGKTTVEDNEDFAELI